MNKNNIYCNVKVIINENIIATKVIIDTGNFLREPITKTPVIVLEKNILNKTIPDNVLNNLDEIIIGNNLDIGEYSSRIRIIPFKSLGRENGILLGIKADKAIIQTEENIITTKNIIIGIYNGNLNKTGKYHGLIGLEVIENSYNDNLSFESYKKEEKI